MPVENKREAVTYQQLRFGTVPILSSFAEKHAVWKIINCRSRHWNWITLRS